MVKRYKQHRSDKSDDDGHTCVAQQSDLSDKKCASGPERFHYSLNVEKNRRRKRIKIRTIEELLSRKSGGYHIGWVTGCPLQRSDRLQCPPHGSERVRMKRVVSRKVRLAGSARAAHRPPYKSLETLFKA